MAVRSRGLDQRGQRLEPRLGEKHGQARLADLALAQVGVAVAVAAERDLRVVDMQAAQALETNLGFELVDDLAQGFDGPDLIAGGEQVAAVEARAETLVAAGKLDQLGELVEVAAERSRGSGRVLEQQRA